MRTTRAIVWTVLLATAAGCGAYDPQRAAEDEQRAADQRQEDALQTQRAAAIQSIVVTPGDFSGRPYSIVGPVDYPGAGMTVIGLVGPASCTPDNARLAAVQQYGQVDAIIGFTQWRDGSTPHCGGTAIRFTRP